MTGIPRSMGVSDNSGGVDVDVERGLGSVWSGEERVARVGDNEL
jgi:hypothetical protein